MSEAAAPVAAPAVAPSNGAHPTTPQKPANPAPVASKPVEVDDSEEYNVDGKPVRLTKAQRQLHIQKGLAADKRFKEAADERAKAEDLRKLAESDPEEFLRKIGKDPEKVYAEQMAKRAAAALKTPDQLEAEKIAKERDDAKAKLDKYEKAEKAKRDAERDAIEFGKLEKSLLAAADKFNLDSTPETLESLCEIALEHIGYGVTISPEQIAQEHIRRESEHIQKRDAKLLNVLSGKKLLAYIGPAALAKVKEALAEADADSLKQIPAPQAKPKVQVRAHEREVKGHIRETDFDKKFGL